MSQDKQEVNDLKQYEDITHFENFSNFMSVWDQHPSSIKEAAYADERILERFIRIDVDKSKEQENK
jgi:hypothetical protein